MLSLPNDGFDQLKGLLLAQRLQGGLCDRQFASQISQPSRNRRGELQLIAAYCAQQQQPTAMAFPGMCQLAQQVEGDSVHPLQVLRGIFLLQPQPQRLDHRLVGQSSSQLEGMSTQHHGPLGSGPGHKLVGQPRFADARPTIGAMRSPGG